MFKLLSIFKFFKTRLGIIILVAAATMIFAFLYKKPQSKPEKSKESTNSNVYFTVSEEQKEQPITTINRNTASVRTTLVPQPRIFTETILQDVNDPSQKNDCSSKIDKQFPIVLNIYNKIMDSPKEEAPEAVIMKQKPKELIAPFGRMIKCELINTVDSGNLETPIIGLVMEPIYWNGNLIIPAGSEVHGIAITDKLRERIASGNKWNIVLSVEDDRLNFPWSPNVGPSATSPFWQHSWWRKD